ncbi:hypothetical protein ABZ297_26880 [Nonomuraea sp. NPDC005983]|uniref:hypothetical protein n=1 Tax=Nonomuraea sp. NPDC005983 TaxID=3155595 RepID=UPI0033B92C2E
MTPSKSRLALAAIATAVSLAACTSATDQAATSASASTASTSAQAGKVSANTADESQIATALQAAGVANAERWAREVVEYRPYDAGDSDLTSLRQNLAKYNPGEETVNKIVSALTP